MPLTGERTMLQLVPGLMEQARRHLHRWLPTLVVTAFSILPALYRFADPLWSMDEAILLVYPEQILAGRVPILDFFSAYGPGGYANSPRSSRSLGLV